MKHGYAMRSGWHSNRKLSAGRCNAIRDVGALRDEHGRDEPDRRRFLESSNRLGWRRVGDGMFGHAAGLF